MANASHQVALCGAYALYGVQEAVENTDGSYTPIPDSYYGNVCDDLRMINFTYKPVYVEPWLDNSDISGEDFPDCIEYDDLAATQGDDITQAQAITRVVQEINTQIGYELG
jgi:hypothetical protein